MDLSRSLSPVFPRATLERRNQTMVAMACPTPDDEPAFLTFALLWYDFPTRRLRDRHPDLRRAIPLQLFLPETAGCLTAQRLWYLDSDLFTCRLFASMTTARPAKWIRTTWETLKPLCCLLSKHPD
jgi:hypothetical protein